MNWESLPSSSRRSFEDQPSRGGHHDLGCGPPVREDARWGRSAPSRPRGLPPDCLTLRSLLPSGFPRANSAYHEQVLGTSLEIRWVSTAWRVGPVRNKIEREALAEIRRLDAVFSTFRADSELSRWMAKPGRRIEVSSELAQLLRWAAWWRTRTLGAFDPICAEWTRLWKTGRRPGDDDGWPEPTIARPLWEVSRPRGGGPSIAKKLTPSAISLDAIAKGYIVDRACVRAIRAARPAHTSDVLVNLGGDIRHVGAHRAVVGVTDPRVDAENARRLEYVGIRNQGLATSGGYRRRIGGNGARSHLIDPRCGCSVEHILSASVIAPTTATADVLATAFSVLEPRQSLAIADSMSGVGCLLIQPDGHRIANARWNRHVVTRQAERPISRRRMVAAGLALSLGWGTSPLRIRGHQSRRPSARGTRGTHRQVPWDERFELAITFTIGDPRGGMRARRPYVVVYIDDAEANPVRTVSLWAQDASWVRSLRRWYRQERARQAEQGVGLLSTVTSPTRNPGRYTVIWDGRDDHGALVDQGEYFVCLETVRQGSSDYFAREPITLESTPFVAQMDPYGTFRDIELDFRERT